MRIEPGWLLTLGLVTLLLGARAAARQRRLRRMLAAGAISNLGLVVTALAVGLVGRELEANAIAVLAFTAALLQLVFDVLARVLLALGARALVRSGGGEEVDSLGESLRPRPRLALLSTVGAAALLALPPFGGFFGALLLACAALEGAAILPPPAAAPLYLVLLVLGLASALSLESLGHAFGPNGFVPARRRNGAEDGGEPSPAELAPLALLAAACLLGGLGAPFLLELARPLVAPLLGDPSSWEWCWREHVRLVVLGGVAGASLLGATIVACAGARRWRLARASR